MFTRKVILIFAILFASLLSCTRSKPVDALSIIMQLPEQKSTILLPDNMAIQLKNDFNIISFSQIDSIQTSDNTIFTESVFYQKARSLGVQYIIVSSEMTNGTDHNFPWITNKNFKVCPGKPNQNSNGYYTLLVWDYAKDSYHFFKFLYEDE